MRIYIYITCTHIHRYKSTSIHIHCVCIYIYIYIYIYACTHEFGCGEQGSGSSSRESLERACRRLEGTCAERFSVLPRTFRGLATEATVQAGVLAVVPSWPGGDPHASSPPGWNSDVARLRIDSRRKENICFTWLQPMSANSAGIKSTKTPWFKKK